jgi:hypothetical protein
VNALTTISAPNIVRETGADTYAFAHARLRQTVVAGLSAARHRLLRRRLANAVQAGLPAAAHALSAVEMPFPAQTQ